MTLQVEGLHSDARAPRVSSPGSFALQFVAIALLCAVVGVGIGRSVSPMQPGDENPAIEAIASGP